MNIIAEVGSVHDGSLGNALCLIRVAAECGADAVKFQTHIAAAETLPDAPCPPYFKGEPRYAYFERTGFSPEQWAQLKAECETVGIEFLSSPFSEEAVALLDKLGVARYKVPSGEITNIPLLDAVGRTGKPVLLSSGMSTWLELDEAVATIRAYHSRLALLQCTTQYPCPPERVGLNVLAEMRARYDLPVGLSDHTLTNEAAFAAVALGAAVIEKHLTFSRRMYGSDAPHSLEPAEFADLARGVRAVEAMLRSPVDKDAVNELATMKRTFEKSIVALVDIPVGSVLAADMLGMRKPGTGLPGRRFKEILGRRTTSPIAKGAMIREDDLTDA